MHTVVPISHKVMIGSIICNLKKFLLLFFSSVSGCKLVQTLHEQEKTFRIKIGKRVTKNEV